MRVTNKIIQNNSLNNINSNKALQDKLSTQMSTEKKLTRPSDDPVVAIRALRLRTSVTQISQYYTKNIPDANSWLEVTEDALSNLSQLLTDMRTYAVKGANGDWTADDRQTIMTSLQKYTEECYSTANADYAGRYVFSGYRTDTPIAFTDKQTRQYDIIEQIDKDVLDSIIHVDISNSSNQKVTDINAANYGSVSMSETDVQATTIPRLRLSYDNCDEDVVPTIKYNKITEDTSVTPPTYTATATTMTISTVKHSYDVSPSPYEIAYGTDGTDGTSVFLADTGEILLSKSDYDALMATRDLPNTGTIDESEIQVTYTKSDWLKGDLRPEHFFYCEATDVASDGTKTSIKYNEGYLDHTAEEQVIEYDVGFNQTLRVNATAKETFQPGIKREAEDMLAALKELINIESTVSKLDDIQKTASTDAQKTAIAAQIDAANKAYTLVKDKVQKLFEGSITAFDNYLAASNLATTETGTRSKKLELIESRMQNQKTTFETLKSENEDIDITEVAINLSSAEMTYEAALMATGKVTQNTLLNYI